ncbi:MAG TPA: protein kinase [Syntrophobacteria bacterium]|nr:protein kinase [Syntrophobacteria bacterium]
MTKGDPIRFGKYVLLDKVASGGMAELYKAKITGIQGFEKLIAIKRILPHLATEEELVTSFIDEAKLAALLHHQNIVQIYDFGRIEDSYYIAMEYLLGKDLRLVMRKANLDGKPLSLETTLLIVSRICAALEYSHGLKDFQGKPLSIIHRDVSPANVLLTYDGNVKIVDFGIAKAATQSHLTQAGMIKGKVAYMSPEQAAGETIDLRSDIFSTGIILYELATGMPMFQGDTLQILNLVRNAKFTPAGHVSPQLPEKFHAILDRALAKERDSRYQSAGDMLADIEELMYQMSARTSPRQVADYMKVLFEEEMAAEKTGMLEVEPRAVADSGIAPPAPAAEAERPEEIGKEAPVPEPKPSGVENEAKPKRRGMLYAAVAAVVIVVGLVFTLVVKPKPGPVPEKQTPASVKETPAEKVAPPATPPSVPASSKTPEPGVAKLEEGMANLKLGRFGEATKSFDEALTTNPSLLDRASKPYAQALRGEAAAVTATDPPKAKALLVKAVGLDPSNIDGLSQLAGLCLREKDYPKAIETYEKVAKTDPKRADALFNLGYAYAVTKDYSKAEQAYGKVVDLAPPYLDEALFNLAMVQVKLGKRDQSVKNLERAIQVNPKNEGAKQYLETLKKGA